MTRLSTTLLLATAAALTGAMPAGANDRYGEPPAIIVSPDLSAPWVMQLRRAPVRSQRALPAPVVTQDVIVIGKDVRRAKRKAARPEPLFQSSGVIRIDNEGRVLPEPIVQQAAYVKPKRMSQDQAYEFDDRFLPQDVSYEGGEKAGTIVIDTDNKFLYLVSGGGMARRYGVGVGKEGFLWHGTQKITNKREWPDWRPPAEMIKRVREKEGRELPVFMAGGPENPLGARAMYLGSTQYRIHGTNQPWTIGHNVSSGCIRMRNEDVVDLFERVKVGTTVIVR